jgi:hypothetical protein
VFSSNPEAMYREQGESAGLEVGTKTFMALKSAIRRIHLIRKELELC